MAEMTMQKIIQKSEQQIIPLEKLKVNPLNSFERDKYDDLKNSIISYGLITPITVIGPDEAGQYTLIAGEQRFRVFTELNESGEPGFDKMPAYIVGDLSMSETEQQLLIEASNIDVRELANKNVHYFKIVSLMRDLAKEKDMSKKDYVKLRSEYFKCSNRYARLYEQIFDSENEDLQQMVVDGKVSVSRAGRIATMPKEQQLEAISDLNNGVSQDVVVKKHKLPSKSEDYDDLISDDEISMVESFSDENPFEFAYNDSFSNDKDLDFDEEIDFNTFNTSSLNCNSILSEKNTNKDLRAVLAWCEHMKKVTHPSDEEWEAIEACKVIVNKFSNN